MNCPKCNKEVMADRFFCTWCEAFIPNPQIGKRAGIFSRWFATAIDPLLVIILYLLVVLIFGGVAGAFSGGAAIGMIVLVTIAYAIFFLWFLSKGMTPGKWLLGEQVVKKLDGDYPGFWRMILRETIGKFLSGLVLGLGYFWAIWDKDSQAWHDKIAGTVVIKRYRKEGSQKILFTGGAAVVILAAALMLLVGGKSSAPPKTKYKTKTAKTPASEASKNEGSTVEIKNTTKKQDSAAYIPTNLDGNWEGYFISYGTKINFELNISQNGSSISGRIIEDGIDKAKISGSIKDNRVTFIKNYEGSSLEPVEYVGTLSNNKMKGKWYIKNFDTSGEWSAMKRS